MVSLQTSIAKRLTQKQLQKNGSTTPAGDGSSSSSSSKPTDTSCPAAKPTASVAPVVHREWDSSSSASASASSASDSVTKVTESVVGSSGHSGGTTKSGQDPVNGASEQLPPCSSSGSSKPGAISLLHGNLTSGGVVNGEAEILDVQKAKVEAAATSLRTRSNSADAAGVIKVSWHGSDKTVNQAGSSAAAAPPLGQPQGSHTTAAQGKNIVISTINKVNNTVVTKVLPSGGGGAATSKVVLPPGVGVAARSVPGSSSILSPRVLVQPSLQRLGGGGASSSSSSSVSSSQGQGSAGTQTKVISVSTSTSGQCGVPTSKS